MKYFVISMSIVFMVFACAPSVKKPPKIAEYEVRTMLARVKKATKAEDVPAIMAFMADDVEISIMARGPLGSTRKIMDREDYEREIRLGMALTENYDFRTDIRDITIAPDGLSAVVEIDIYETVEMLGVKATSITRETSLIRRRDGKLKFVKINAESEIQMTPRPGSRAPSVLEGI